MKELKEQIKATLKQLEEMIKNGANKSKVIKQRKKLDDLLKRYVKDL